MKFLLFFSMLLASIASLNGLEKDDSKIPMLKQLAAKAIIKHGISIADTTVPAEVAKVIKHEMLGDQKLDCIEILKKVRVSREKITELPSIQFIVSLSPNGKKLLAYHSEKLTFAVYHADSGKIAYEIPKHCNCISVPLYSFSYDGNDLAFYTPCIENNQEKLEIFRSGQGRIQSILFSDFCAKTVKLSRDGMMCVCAGGCGVPLRIFKRKSGKENFEFAGSFGYGYFIAISPDNKKIATLSHGELVVYDTETQKELYQVTAYDVANLQFSLQNDDVFIAGPDKPTAIRKTGGNEACGKVIQLRVDEKTIPLSVALSSNGKKAISLVDGKIQFTYLFGDADNILEIERPFENKDLHAQEKFNLVRLHNDDTVITACTHHAVYRYDVKQLQDVESRFAKSIESIAIDDIPIALALMRMTESEYKKRALQPAQETQLDKKIRALMGTQNQVPSLLQRMKFPLLGVAAAAGLVFFMCGRGE